jgi:hypothetical protein
MLTSIPGSISNHIINPMRLRRFNPVEFDSRPHPATLGYSVSA